MQYAEITSKLHIKTRAYTFATSKSQPDDLLELIIMNTSTVRCSNFDSGPKIPYPSLP